MENLDLIQGMMVSLAVLVPIITGVVEAIKRSFELDARYLPLIAIGVGIAGGLVILGLSVSAGVVGLVAGLAATGLYEAGKNTVGATGVVRM